MVNISCFLCLSSENTDHCKKCGKVYTCKKHVKTHRSKSGACYPYRVQYDYEKGKYLEATRNIKQGEIIIYEDPLVLGPSTKSKPQCLNCFKCIDSKSRFYCPGCDYPVCDVGCASGRYHTDECELFKSVGLKAVIEDFDEFDDQYSAVTVLRLLRLMEKEDGMSRDDKSEHIVGMIGNLMDHNEERELEQPDVWSFEKEFVINFIQKVTDNIKYKQI